MVSPTSPVTRDKDGSLVLGQGNRLREDLLPPLGLLGSLDDVSLEPPKSRTSGLRPRNYPFVVSVSSGVSVGSRVPESSGIIHGRLSALVTR